VKGRDGRMGASTGRIPKDAMPAGLPALQSSKFELVISLYRTFGSFRTSLTNRISITSS
jgi:hypothetical protein